MWWINSYGEGNKEVGEETRWKCKEYKLTNTGKDSNKPIYHSADYRSGLIGKGKTCVFGR